MTATHSGFTRLVHRDDRWAFAFLLAALTVETVFFIVLGPLLPRYASQLHLSKLGAGVLSASYAFGCGIAAIPAGVLVGRIGPRVVTLVGLVMVGVACGCFAEFHRIAMLDGARMVQGVGGAALWAGAISWVMSLGDDGDRGSLIGIAFSAASFGACLGPVVAALASVTSPRGVFLLLAAAILALACAGVRLALSRPPAGPALAIPSTDHALLPALVSPAMRRSLAMVALPSVAFGVAGVLVPLRLHQLGVTAATIAAGYFAAALLEGLVSQLVGRWYDRRGGPHVLRACLFGSLICVLVLAAGLPAFALLLALAISWPVLGSVWVPALADLTDAVRQAGGRPGLGLGIFNFVWALSQAAGAVGGAQLARLLEAAPFLVLAALYVGGIRSASRRVALSNAYV